ncbi:hypothetical protein HDK77DRAFT_496650 [Phyllosticta capitalensis]|uniref:Integral membrane protein n=2 Tax=Phyllosticta capitalensis TaxID=121624 RepID=A0ABR1Y8S3_9PEZI
MASPALLALLFLLTLCAAQQVQLINYGALPSCAKGCTTLKTAQDGCIPPQAQVSTQQTYVSCFCQSAFLVNLKTTAQGLCDAACPSTSDQNSIKDWYNKYCSSGGTEGAAAAGSDNKPSATTASTAPSATSSAKDESNNQGVVGDKNKSGYEGSWLSAHWRWIVMLVVIFTSLTLLTLLGIYLKRRARARHDARQANVAAPEAAFSAPLPPAAPPMAHHPKPDDSGTLTSTIDFGSTSSITAAAPGPNSSVGNIAQNFLGRNRTTSNPLSLNENNVVQPVPSPHNVWGPHQHQAATRGYEYPTYQHAGRHIPSPADYSPVTGSTGVSPVGGSPNASWPHVAGVPGAGGHGPSPLGNGAPRKTSSRGELVNKATPPPLIASAGHAPTSESKRDRTPPSAASSTRPEVPRLNTAVGGGSAKTPPPMPMSKTPTTPPRQTGPVIGVPTPPSGSGDNDTPPTIATATAVNVGAVPRPPVAGSHRDGRHHERTRSQEYGAEARYHNAGFATGGAGGSRREVRREDKEKERGREGWTVTSSRENLRRGRGGALVAGDEEDRQQEVGDAVAGMEEGDAFDLGSGGSGNGSAMAAGGGGSRRRVTSPLSADNAREKLRRKLSRQGSGFFGEGEEGRGEREGLEGRF